MIEGFPVVSLLDGLGVVGVVLLIGWLVASGRLVTRREVDGIRKMASDQLEDMKEDRDQWRAAHRISETARAESVAQMTQLLEHARTTDTFIRSLPHPRDES